MSLKVIREGDDRYSLWSARATGFLLEDVSEARLREWYADAPEGATLPDVDALVEAADALARDVGAHTYVEAEEYLSGD